MDAPANQSSDVPFPISRTPAGTAAATPTPLPLFPVLKRLKASYRNHSVYQLSDCQYKTVGLIGLAATLIKGRLTTTSGFSELSVSSPSMR
jgi:hypothetical protein